MILQFTDHQDNLSIPTTKEFASFASTENRKEIEEIFKNELPFPMNYSPDLYEPDCPSSYKGFKDNELDVSTRELLADGNQKTTYASDGFIGFHHLKYITSNSKQLAKLFVLTMGFREVAYKGLENNSRLLASHVVQNNRVVIEFISTLESEMNDISNLPSLANDAAYLQSLTTENNADSSLSQVNQILNSLSKELIGKYQIKSSDKRALLLGLLDKNEIKTYKDKMMGNISRFSEECTSKIENTIDSNNFSNFLYKRGEGIIDISLEVEDVEHIFFQSVSNGAHVVKLPRIISSDQGSVKIATISVPSTDIRHTLVQNIDFTGIFLPGYIEPLDEFNVTFPKPVEFSVIDHCVENFTWNQMKAQAEFYAQIFKFHKFWSVDETDISTEESSLNSTVMASGNEKIKIPINEPSKGKMKSQIEEFYDFNGGPGIQHVALRTNNIVETVSAMKSNGVEFNSIGVEYYKNLINRLVKDDIMLKEDFVKLMDLNILVDYDPSTRNKKTKNCNYILQIFTKPLNDRPTLFIEVIQRHHHTGFGKGTFKGLFETIEKQQRLRGNLVPSDH